MSLVASRPVGTKTTVGAVMREIRRRLHDAGVDSAEQEAGWLMEHALGLSPLRQNMDGNRALSGEEIDALEALVAKREARVPLQYLLGTQEFCGLEFEVNPSVLIPRPETELLVRELLSRIRATERPVLFDICTGSGCLAVSLAHRVRGGRVYASDVSPEALLTAGRNAERHRVASSITWLAGDLLKPFSALDLTGSVDAILSNPPYIAEVDWPALQPEVRLYEPRLALVAGVRGTEYHERLLIDSMPYLKPGGLLLLEIGKGQSMSVSEKARAMDGYRSVDVVRDDAGIDRLVVVERADKIDG